MQIETNIISTFKKLVASEGFEKVSISKICTNTGVSRKTFYTHFNDKHNLLEKIFYFDIIKPIEDLRVILPTDTIKSAPQLLTETIHRTIASHSDFYQKLFGCPGTDGSISRDISMILLTRQIAQINQSILHLESFSEAEQEYIAYFFAAVHVALISKWIREKMILTPEQLAQIFVKYSAPAFRTFNKPKNPW